MALIYTLRDNVNTNTYSNDPTSHNYLNVQRSPVMVTGDLQRSTLSLSIASDRADESPFNDYLSGGYGLGNIRLDLNDDIANVKHFTGLMYNISVNDQQIKMDFASPFSATQRADGRKYQRTCPFYLYDQRTCQVDRNDSRFKITRNVASIDATKSIITLDRALPADKPLLNGSFEFNNILFWIRFISLDRLDVHLRAPVKHLTFQDGVEVNLYVSCDKSIATCHNVFNNAQHFGGMAKHTASKLRDDTTNPEEEMNYGRDLVSDAITGDLLEGDQFYEDCRGVALINTPTEQYYRESDTLLGTYQWQIDSLKQSSPLLFGLDPNPTTPGAVEQVATPATVTPISTAPAAPTGLTLTSRTHDTIVVSWTAPVNSESQEIRIGDLLTQGNWVEIGSEVTTYTFDKLTASTAYSIHVRAVNAFGTGSQAELDTSTLATPTPPAQAPAAPQGLSASTEYVTGGTAKVDLMWTAITDILRYEVREREGSKAFGNWRDIGKASATAQVLSLKLATAYTYQVRAVNDVGNGARSSVTITTASAPTAPAAPTGLTADVTAQRRISLSWTKADDNFTHWEVRITAGSTAGGGWLATTNKDAEYVFLSLTPATQYTIQVRGVNVDIAGAAATVMATVAQIPAPDAPTMHTPIPAITTMRISWTAASTGEPAASFQVRIASGSWITATSPHTFTGLTPNTEYTMDVRAVNAGGTSTIVSRTAMTTVAKVATPTFVSERLQRSASARTFYYTITINVSATTIFARVYGQGRTPPPYTARTRVITNDQSAISFTIGADPSTLPATLVVDLFGATTGFANSDILTRTVTLSTAADVR